MSGVINLPHEEHRAVLSLTAKYIYLQLTTTKDLLRHINDLNIVMQYKGEHKIRENQSTKHYSYSKCTLYIA